MRQANWPQGRSKVVKYNMHTLFDKSGARQKNFTTSDFATGKLFSYAPSTKIGGAFWGLCIMDQNTEDWNAEGRKGPKEQRQSTKRYGQTKG